MKQKRLSSWRRLVLLPSLFVAMLMSTIVGSLTAYAQDVNTISIDSSATLDERIGVVLSITATCTLPQGATLNVSFGGTNLAQAGREIAAGTGNFAPVCDGKARTYQSVITPQAGSPSFHDGHAIAKAIFTTFFTDASGTSGSVSAIADDVTIRLISK